MAIAAELISSAKGKGRRGAVRHEMKLRVRGTRGSEKVSDVLVRNLSATGILLETDAKLRVGQTIAVDLPETGRVSTQILWASGQLLGCEFERPLSDAAVSAAQLRSEPRTISDEPGPASTADASETAPSFGETIRRLRQERGWSLVEFARKMNVSRPTVWAWEAGRSSPRFKKRRLLLDVLQVSEAELKGYSGSAGNAGPREVPLEDPGTLQSAIGDAKASIAAAAGTTPDKVTVIIEV